MHIPLRDLLEERWSDVLAWHAEALRLGRAQRLPMVEIVPAVEEPSPEVLAALAPPEPDAKVDSLAEARRRFATT
ncbi:MAG: hypothetical protein AB7U48_15965 [Bauldia sp.]